MTETLRRGYPGMKVHALYHPQFSISACLHPKAARQDLQQVYTLGLCMTLAYCVRSPSRTCRCFKMGHPLVASPQSDMHADSPALVLRDLPFLQ